MASGTKINIDLVLNTKGFRPLGRINGQLGEFEKSLDASNARVLAFGASAKIYHGVPVDLERDCNGLVRDRFRERRA